MRNRLPRLYDFFGGLAALFLLATLLIILVNILGRQFGFFLRGADAYAGYSIAAVAFLALASTLKKGEHIRVTLIFQRLKGRSRRALQVWCFTAGSMLCAYFSFFSWKMVWFSYRFHDISQGQDATPLWIPQTAMALGLSVLTLALLEGLVTSLRGGTTEVAESRETVSYVE